ncbi:MAG: ATP-binding cassette domain-containing protein [Candidatus Aminicenantes bacterium]|nr:ATP-binding cassette domain-containing protein [Candidatus Aminicenantes bacterium]
MENNHIIKIKDLVKIYPMGMRKLTALQDINLSIKKGEFTGVVGPSGSGKTTLLNIIGALDHPTKGYAEVLGHKIESLTDTKAAKLRNQNVGFIFQSYNLLPIYSVYENVELPLLLLDMDKPKRREMVKEALDWLGILDKIDSKPSQLSGGERQRVSVARAMVKRPEIVLADEPTANLDSKNAHNILERMVKLNEELETTFIFASHDHKVIQYLRRQIVLEDGRVSEDERKSPDH